MPAAGPRASPAPVALAVDGGNSKTDVVLVQADGSVLGRARGQGSNHQLVGMEGALEALSAAIAAAGAAGGMPVTTPLCGTGVFCLAGLDLPVDELRLSEALGSRGWVQRLVLHNDTMAVSRVGMTDGWGVGVVCGTGINCAGIGPDGATVRFPSLGELSGDLAAGGAWLGTRALGLALRALDGRGPDTVLAQAVPDHFGLGSPEEVLEAVYLGELSFARLFELAEVLLDAASDGDRPARQAADQLADEVVAMVVATIRRLHLHLADLRVEVVLGGGVFDTRDAGFLERVERGILHAAPNAVLRRIDLPPVAGAALLALDELNAPSEAGRRLRRDLGAG